MRRLRLDPRLLPLLAWAVLTVPAGGTLIRQDLASLVAGHSTIVVGQVVEAHPYWNADSSFIVTDYKVKATQVLKGDARKSELTVTLLGGTVGDLSVVVPGGARYLPGRTYLLFLADTPLPGSTGEWSAPAHSQGVFEVVHARDGFRAISQAASHPLYPDAFGFVDPPGGAEGLLLDEIVRQVRDAAARQAAEPAGTTEKEVRQ